MRVNGEVLSGEVFEAKALVMKGKTMGDPRRTVLIRIPPKDGESVQQLVDRLNNEAAIEAGLKSTKGLKRLPFAHGDEVKETQDGDRRRFPEQAAGYGVVRASSKYDVDLVEGKNKVPLAKDHFFGGVRCQMVAKAGSYNGSDGQGLTLFLNGLWVLGPGKDRFSVGKSTEYDEESSVEFTDFADGVSSFDLAD